jgi:thiamine-phosphate pyrophosphorylase
MDDYPHGGKLVRILDANANRAREGIRVVEDYCRFVLDNAELSRALKWMRHDVTEQMNALFATSSLVQARDSESDVGAPGRDIPEGAETEPAQIVLANIKRVQEALRCLEEYSKAIDARVSERFKKMRFDLYSLEKELLPILDGR